MFTAMLHRAIAVMEDTFNVMLLVLFLYFGILFAFEGFSAINVSKARCRNCRGERSHVAPIRPRAILFVRTLYGVSRHLAPVERFRIVPLLIKISGATPEASGNIDHDRRSNREASIFYDHASDEIRRIWSDNISRWEIDNRIDPNR